MPMSGLATIEQSAISQPRGLDEAGRSYFGVRILGDTGELVPVDSAIEPDSEPTSVAETYGGTKNLS